MCFPLPENSESGRLILQTVLRLLHYLSKVIIGLRLYLLCRLSQKTSVPRPKHHGTLLHYLIYVEGIKPFRRLLLSLLLRKNSIRLSRLSVHPSLSPLQKNPWLLYLSYDLSRQRRLFFSLRLWRSLATFLSPFSLGLCHRLWHLRFYSSSYPFLLIEDHLPML